MEAARHVWFDVRLTNAGQDFVEYASNDKTWSRAKQHITDNRAAMTIENLTSLLRRASREQLGLPPDTP